MIGVVDDDVPDERLEQRLVLAGEREDLPHEGERARERAERALRRRRVGVRLRQRARGDGRRLRRLAERRLPRPGATSGAAHRGGGAAARARHRRGVFGRRSSSPTAHRRPQRGAPAAAPRRRRRAPAPSARPSAAARPSSSAPSRADMPRDRAAALTVCAPAARRRRGRAACGGRASAPAARPSPCSRGSRGVAGGARHRRGGSIGAGMPIIVRFAAAGGHRRRRARRRRGAARRRLGASHRRQRRRIDPERRQIRRRHLHGAEVVRLRLGRADDDAGRRCFDRRRRLYAWPARRARCGLLARRQRRPHLGRQLRRHARAIVGARARRAPSPRCRDAAAAAAHVIAGAARGRSAPCRQSRCLSPSASCCTPYTKLPLRSVPDVRVEILDVHVARAVDGDARVALGGAPDSSRSAHAGAPADVDLGPIDDERLALPPGELQHWCHAPMLADRQRRGKAGSGCALCHLLRCGRASVKMQPWPGCWCTRREPPCASAHSRASASPSPKPVRVLGALHERAGTADRRAPRRCRRTSRRSSKVRNVAVHRRLQRHGAAGLRELHGVRRQVLQRRAQQARVGVAGQIGSRRRRRW